MIRRLETCRPASIWPTGGAVAERFGTTPWRGPLEGLAHALRDLRTAGCKRAYIDGSFITPKESR